MTHLMNMNNKKIVLLLLLITFIAGAVWCWEDILKDRILPRRWGVVEEGLIYRSGQLNHSLIKKTLKRYNIAVIINLTFDDPADQNQQVEMQSAAELGIQVFRFPLRGNGTGDIHHYADAVGALATAHRAHKPVLVHCAAGTQRTGGVIACYRVLIEGKTPEFALKEMMQYGWNPKDDAALLEYLNEHMADLVDMLIEKSLIPEKPDPLPKFKLGGV